MPKFKKFSLLLFLLLAANLAECTKNTGVNPQTQDQQDCFQKQFTLNYGFYQLGIQFTAQFLKDFQNIPLNIVWNDKTIETLPATRNPSVFRYKFKVFAIQGENQFQIIPEKNQILCRYKNYLIDIKLQYLNCNTIYSSDILINGDFQQVRCHGLWCIWNAHNFNQLSVPGWIPEPQIEVGRPAIYNGNLVKPFKLSWVAELKPNYQNSCIKQRFHFRQGLYMLDFKWAARAKFPLQSSRFNVKINNKIIKSLVPQHYGQYIQSISFMLQDNLHQNWIAFCSQGSDSGSGAAIDDVKLIRTNSC